MNIKEFTVKQSRWLRGAHDGKGYVTCSRLLNEEGQMCCMGFLAKACGIPEEVREKAMYFSSVHFEPFDELLPGALRPRPDDSDDRGHGELAQEIYWANDNTTIKDDERKVWLTSLFAQAGIVIRFIP